ncbi:MAG: acyltransferase family protein, partial [Terracidiphilus sp.]
PILRILSYLLLPAMRGWDSNGFESLVDLLMAGCVSAFLLDSAVWRKRIRTIPAWPTLAVTSASLLIITPWVSSHLPQHSNLSAIAYLLMPTLEGAMIALTLLVLVAGKHGLPFRVLNSPIAAHFGKLSYSIYIWQQLLLPLNSDSSALPLLWRLPAVYLVAFCSFRLVERPLLKLRSQFRQGASI